MISPKARMVCVTVLSLGVSQLAMAQSRQPWSIQASGLYTAQDLGGNAGTVGGLGFEGQIRRTFPRWSFGTGVQYSTHSSGGDDLSLTGVFVEPRIVLNTSLGGFAPYLAGRVAFLHAKLTSDLAGGGGTSNGFAVGAGAGLIYPLTRRVNFDVGGAVLRQSLGNMTLDNGADTRLEFPSFFGFVLKAGLSVGFEGSKSSSLRR
jgi:hypothetical protein